ncbi:hypothetical protein COOONC_25024 [Cooperia oncophora]
MRSFYNAELSVVGTPSDPPYKSVAEGWLAALQLNPARLVPDRQRLESMRDMYEADQLSPSDDPMMEALMGTDPFYDRFPWFRMIGRWVLLFIGQCYFLVSLSVGTLFTTGRQYMTS